MRNKVFIIGSFALGFGLGACFTRGQFIAAMGLLAGWLIACTVLVIFRGH